MKTKLHTSSDRSCGVSRSGVLAFLTLLTLSTINSQLSTLLAQGTAFTYQGRLTDNGSLANGYYDMLFCLYDAPTMGTQVDGTLMGTAVPVTNGLFAISLDFGAGIFTGSPRWLKIDVRTNNGAAPYSPLSPRQALTATPYAITAGNAARLFDFDLEKLAQTPAAQVPWPALSLSGTA